jgi:hypothetical protein
MDCDDSHQPSEPDYQGERQVRVVRLPQNNQSQLSPEAMQSYDHYMADEKYDERAQSEKVQAACALSSMKDFDIPRESSSDGRGHRHPCRDTERREQEYDRTVAQLL